MSVKAMSAIFEAEGLTSTEKLILLALADHASEDGLNIYPSVGTVCRKTALSERVVRKIISNLRAPERGILFLVKRRGNRQNEYGISLADLHHVHLRPAPRAPLEPTEVHVVPNRPAPRAPKSSVESSDTDQPSKNGADKPRSDSQHPAIQMYRLKAKTYPDKAQFDTIIQSVGELEDSLSFWGKVVKAYIDLGWNKRNIGNMVSYFQRHELPALNGKVRSNGHSVDWKAALNESIERHNGEL